MQTIQVNLPNGSTVILSLLHPGLDGQVEFLGFPAADSSTPEEGQQQLRLDLEYQMGVLNFQLYRLDDQAKGGDWTNTFGGALINCGMAADDWEDSSLIDTIIHLDLRNFLSAAFNNLSDERLHEFFAGNQNGGEPPNPPPFDVINRDNDGDVEDDDEASDLLAYLQKDHYGNLATQDEATAILQTT